MLVSENGKVAVEYNSAQEEPIDSLTDEELRGLLQVRRGCFVIRYKRTVHLVDPIDAFLLTTSYSVVAVIKSWN